MRIFRFTQQIPDTARAFALPAALTQDVNLIRTPLATTYGPSSIATGLCAAMDFGPKATPARFATGEIDIHVSSNHPIQFDVVRS
jgi:hypothetical protein